MGSRVDGVFIVSKVRIHWFLLRMWFMSSLSRRTLPFRDHFRDPGRSSSPDGSWTGVREVGVIRNWDFNLLVDIEDAYCEFVGACPSFPAAAGREPQVTPLRLA